MCTLFYERENYNALQSTFYFLKNALISLLSIFKASQGNKQHRNSSHFTDEETETKRNGGLPKAPQPLSNGSSPDPRLQEAGIGVFLCTPNGEEFSQRHYTILPSFVNQNLHMCISLKLNSYLMKSS